MRRPLLLGASGLGGLLLFLLLTLFCIPNRALQGVVERAAEQQGLTFRVASFGKALALGVTAREVVRGGADGLLLRADRLTVRLRLLPLLAGKVVVSGVAAIGPGKAEVLFQPRRDDLTVEVAGLRLEDVPFFRSVAGATVRGIGRLSGRIAGPLATGRGELKLEVRGAELAGIKIGGVPLPDAVYPTVQGMLRIAAGKGTLESFTLQGEGIYARLSGSVPLNVPPAAAPLDLTLELMPKPEFLEKQKFVFLLLVKYLDTPGHYRIPVRGTLVKPALQ